MDPHRTKLPHASFVRIAIGVIVAVTALSGFDGTAAAGGWAVTTLDAIPTPHAGEPVDVGFTIRQHGVTPVQLDEGVALEVAAADGTTQTFPAVAQGSIGHYVASVVFPDIGEFTWTVQQGWFGPQDLGALTVGNSSVPGAHGDHRFPAVLRYGLPALAAALGALAIADFVAGRRRRRAVVA